MLVVERLTKSFDDHLVLDDLSFTVKPGELVGLVGPSGGGKSVLLKLLGGIIPADEGRITIDEDGESDSSAECTSDENSVGFLFQEGALFDSLTVVENVVFPQVVVPDLVSSVHENDDDDDSGSTHVTCSQEEALKLAADILVQVGLAKHSLKVPGQLSGGMRRRVALARALVGRPRLVLLDDPTGGLDPVAASVIMNLIKRLHELYRPTMILVSHDIRRLLPNVERVLALFDGRIVADAVPKQLTAKSDPKVIQFLATRFDFSSFDAST